MQKFILIFALTLLCNGMATAAEENLPRFADLRINLPGGNDYLQMAAGGENTAVNEQTVEPQKKPFSDPWFSANKFHQYLGIGSLTLALLTAVVPKPSEGDLNEGSHKKLANGAAVLGGAAMVTGLLFHYDDIFENGVSDPDNLHMLYTSLGVFGYLMAIDEAPVAQHAGYGMIGALFMTIGIKMTW
ncbi:MAG: hypothetical protein OEZ39_01890 [Gammaproteobacteria bacterium]|nr:hypothetical protein [Gammaproteobacteria bacterium]MDH5650605.1 hypothetical protein [Gammaproteobacteria bacterium]